MCEMCYPEGKEIVEIAPGYALIYWKKKYHILAGQGHMDDIILTFPRKPKDVDSSDEEFEAAAIVDRNFKIRPIEGYEFIKQCKKYAKYRPKVHGSFGFWLYDRCAKKIEEFRKLKDG